MARPQFFSLAITRALARSQAGPGTWFAVAAAIAIIVWFMPSKTVLWWSFVVGFLAWGLLFPVFNTHTERKDILACLLFGIVMIGISIAVQIFWRGEAMSFATMSTLLPYGSGLSIQLMGYGMTMVVIGSVAGLAIRGLFSTDKKQGPFP